MLRDSILQKPPLPEKCPNTELFLVRTEKYGPEITPYLITFHAVPTIWLDGSVKNLFFMNCLYQGKTDKVR